MSEFEPSDLEDAAFQSILNLVDIAFLTTTGKPLSTIEIAVLRGSWQNQKYPQIAAQHGYSADYLKNDVGPHLWRQLSQALGEKVSKTNVRAVLLQRFAVASQPNIPASMPSDSPAGERPESQDAFRSARAIAHTNHNLPPRHTQLFGRQSEVDQLLKWLSFDHPTPHVGIVGIGGIGKTTLLLDVAYRCLQEQQSHSASSDATPPKFEAVVFTSAQVHRFATGKVLPRLRREGTLRDILRTIARTLNCPEVPSTNFAEACDGVLQFLEGQRTLLLIDNLETLDDQHDVLSFIHELPGTVKVLISSRCRLPFPTVHLEALPQTDALQLIQYQAQEKELQIDLQDSHRVYHMTAGIPAAIGYVTSQWAMGYAPKAIAADFMQSTHDFARFYFESAIYPLQGKAADLLLKALALFATPPLRETICAVAGIHDPVAATEGLARLQQLSLIQKRQGRFNLLPLTRGYVLQSLASDPMFEPTARSRWVDWYVQYALQHGGKDWREWQDYQFLEQEWGNLTEVIEWCIEHNRYQKVCQLWRSLKCYTYSQAYRLSRLTCWDSPLDWLNWLIPEAQTRQDWAIAAEMLGDRAWKLTLMGQPQHLTAAGILFPQAWELRQYQPIQWQIELAIHIAAWHIQQEDFVPATGWLHQAQTLLDRAQFGSSLTSRHSLLIRYYQGEIYYKTGKYQEGEVLFQHLAEQAQAIGWQRALFLATDFLADIAIQQGQLNKAQQLLLEGLQVAEAHQDQCSQAYTKRSLAQLERQRGHGLVARRWANEAREEFERLGMLPEAQETQALLQVAGLSQ